MSKSIVLAKLDELLEKEYEYDPKKAARALRTPTEDIVAAFKMGEVSDTLATNMGFAFQLDYTYIPKDGDGEHLNSHQLKKLIAKDLRENQIPEKDKAKEFGISEKVFKSALQWNTRRLPKSVIEGYGYTVESELVYWPMESSPGRVPAIVPKDIDLRSYRKLKLALENKVIEMSDEGLSHEEIAKQMNTTVGTLKKALDGQTMPTTGMCLAVDLAPIKQVRYINPKGRVVGAHQFRKLALEHMKDTYGGREQTAEALGCDESQLKSIATEESEAKDKLMNEMGFERIELIKYTRPSGVVKGKQHHYQKKHEEFKKDLLRYETEDGKRLTMVQGARLLKNTVKKDFLTTRLAARKVGISYPKLEEMMKGKRMIEGGALKLIKAKVINVNKAIDKRGMPRYNM